MTSWRKASHKEASPPLPDLLQLLCTWDSLAPNLWHGGVLPPEPLVVEEQGPVPVEEVEVVHHHLTNLLSERQLFWVMSGQGVICRDDVKQASVWKDDSLKTPRPHGLLKSRTLEETRLEWVLDRALLDPLVVGPPGKRTQISQTIFQIFHYPHILSYPYHFNIHSHQFWSTRLFSHRWFCNVWKRRRLILNLLIKVTIYQKPQFLLLSIGNYVFC